MVATNSLAYLVYSLLTLAAHDEPRDDPPFNGLNTEYTREPYGRTEDEAQWRIRSGITQDAGSYWRPWWPQNPIDQSTGPSVTEDPPVTSDSKIWPFDQFPPYTQEPSADVTWDSHNQDHTSEEWITKYPYATEDPDYPSAQRRRSKHHNAEQDPDYPDRVTRYPPDQWSEHKANRDPYNLDHGSDEWTTKYPYATEDPDYPSAKRWRTKYHNAEQDPDFPDRVTRYPPDQWSEHKSNTGI